MFSRNALILFLSPTPYFGKFQNYRKVERIVQQMPFTIYQDWQFFFNHICSSVQTHTHTNIHIYEVCSFFVFPEGFISSFISIY